MIEESDANLGYTWEMNPLKRAMQIFELEKVEEEEKGKVYDREN